MDRKRIEKIIILLALAVSFVIIALGFTWKLTTNNNAYKLASTENILKSEYISPHYQQEQKPQWVKKLNSGEEINAVIIGDGIARSYGCSGPSFTWHYHLTEELKKAAPKATLNWQVSAISGNTVQDGISQLKEAPRDTDIVFICFGRNDTQALSDQDFKNSYGELIKHIKATHQAAETFLIIESPTLSSSALRREDKFRGFAEIIRELGEENKLLIADMYSTFPHNDENLKELLTEDGLTPSNKGYDLYATTVFNVLIKKYPEITAQ